MPLLSEVRFGSYLVYSPSGKSDKSRSSKNICYAVKQDLTMRVGNPAHTVRAIPYLTQHLKSRLAGSPLQNFFARRPVLVPAPRSSPLKPDSLCPTRLICENLVAQGLGSEMQELLRRTQPVPKAAFQAPADRPTIPQHYATIEVDPCRAHHFFFPWKPQSVTYQVLMGSAPRILTLAEEIKASEPRFIDAACAALRKNLTEEYCRLRGYAIEAQRDEITLNVSIVFGFAPENRYVAVSSTPAVNPRPASNMVTVSPPL